MWVLLERMRERLTEFEHLETQLPLEQVELLKKLVTRGRVVADEVRNVNPDKARVSEQLNEIAQTIIEVTRRANLQQSRNDIWRYGLRMLWGIVRVAVAWHGVPLPALPQWLLDWL